MLLFDQIAKLAWEGVTGAAIDVLSLLAKRFQIRCTEILPPSQRLWRRQARAWLTSLFAGRLFVA